MKLLKFTVYMAVVSFIFCNAFAGEDYTMPNGRVLKNAYVVETKPNGVVVGHSTGVMFVKYKKMPEALRKELGFDPAKNAEYEKKLSRKNAMRKKKLAEKNAADAKFRKDLSIRRGKYKITELEDKIKATELRIERLKIEIPKLESDSKTFLDKAVNLASGSRSGGSSFSRGGFWCSRSDRSSRRSANRREVKKRFKAAEAIGEEYSSSKFRLRNYKDELERKILQVDQMKRQLEQLKKRQGVKEGKKPGLLSGLFD